MKRKNLIGLVSIAVLSLIICSNIVIATETEISSMEYDQYFTPTDKLNIQITIGWEKTTYYIDGDITIYYCINEFSWSEAKSFPQLFTPSDTKGVTHYLTADIPNLRDGDKIKFKVYFKWRGVREINHGEVWSNTGKSTFVASGTIPDSNGWSEYSRYVYIGLGVFAGLIALSILTKRRRRK